MRAGADASLQRAAAALAREAATASRRAVAVLAGASGEGTTTITAHLGRSMASLLGLRVLLVDLGEGAPRLGTLLDGLPDPPVRLASAEAPALGTARGWALLDPRLGPGGEAGAWRALPRVIEAAAPHFDLVLVDAPPWPAGAGGLLAARACGSALLVVAAESLTWEPLRAMRDELEHEGVRLLGAVLNRRREQVPGWLARLLR